MNFVSFGAQFLGGLIVFECFSGLISDYYTGESCSTLLCFELESSESKSNELMFFSVLRLTKLLLLGFVAKTGSLLCRLFD